MVDWLQVEKITRESGAHLNSGQETMKGDALVKRVDLRICDMACRSAMFVVY
jgi:hypothetical protein